jgi:hypothetical protein
VLQPGDWTQEQDVVTVDHGRVGRPSMLLPDRTAVERLERPFACLHVGEAAHPDEAVGIVEIPELAVNAHPDRLLCLHELEVEELDQRLPLTGAQRIAAEFDDLTRIGAMHAAEQVSVAVDHVVRAVADEVADLFQ